MTLNNVAWRFTKEHYADQETFSNKVAEYQQAIYKDAGRWKPHEVAFSAPELQLQYMAWVAGLADLLDNETPIEDDKDIFEERPGEDFYQVEINARLKADNGEHFTALEFLMKAHNQMANKELGDHVFFEGTNETPEIIDGLPTCYIACGS